MKSNFLQQKGIKDDINQQSLAFQNDIRVNANSYVRGLYNLLKPWTEEVVTIT